MYVDIYFYTSVLHVHIRIVNILYIPFGQDAHLHWKSFRGPRLFEAVVRQGEEMRHGQNEGRGVLPGSRETSGRFWLLTNDNHK